MTIASEVARIDYNGAGTTGPFPVPFYFFDANDLLVQKTVIATGVSVTLALTTNYTVSGAGVVAGGQVTLVAVLPATERLTIIRDPRLLQGVDYTPNDKFPAETHEKALDRLTMFAQRLKEVVSRCIRLPEGDLSTSVMGTIAARAGKYLGFDGSGSITVLDGTVVTPNLDSITFQQAGAGAVARSAQAKMRDFINVFDFMSAAQVADVQANTNSLDVTSAIQAAINHLNSVGGGTLYLPRGTYRIASKTLYVSSIYYGVRLLANVTLQGDGPGATILKLANAMDSVVVLGYTGADHACVKDMTIDGNRANQTNTAVDGGHAGIFIALVNGNRFERVTLKSCYGEGVYDSVTQFTIMEDIFADDCGLEGISISAASYGHYRNLRIVACGKNYALYTLSKSGLYVSGNVSNCTVENVVSAQNSGYGFALASDTGTSSVKDNTFVGVHTFNNERGGWHIGSNTAANTFVSRNRFFGCGSRLDANTAGEAILMNQATYNEFYGCISYNSKNGAGLHLLSGNVWNKFYGFITFDDQAVKTQTYGIQENAAVGNAGNSFLNLDVGLGGFVTAAISISTAFVLRWDSVRARMELIYDNAGIILSNAAGTKRWELSNGFAAPGDGIFSIYDITNGRAVLQCTASGGVAVPTVGQGLLVKEGANAKQGVSAAMVAGTISVANTSVTANSRIVLTRQEGGANPGAVYVSARVAGTSFDITSTNAGDTGIVAYQIFEPAT